MYRVQWTATNIAYVSWGALVSFTQDINTAMFGLIFCIGVDTLTGFIAAPYRGQLRKSAKLKAVVSKIITYSIAIISLHVLEKLIFPDYGTAMGLQLARCGCTIFAALEVYSTLENLYDITGLRVFKVLTQFTLKKVQQVTEVDITEGVEDDEKRVEKTVGKKRKS